MCIIQEQQWYRKKKISVLIMLATLLHQPGLYFAGEKLDVLVNIHKQVIITQAQYRLRK